MLVTSNDQLASACARYKQAPALGLDTEFERSRTFYPRAALFQITDGDQVSLVDPLAVTDMSPLFDLLGDPAIVKVLHSCSEDMEVIHVLGAPIPERIFDTQIAAAFAGHGASLSYSALARELLGVEVPKDETRSDWLQRPLTESQLEYAALDVAYLLPLRQKLMDENRELGREAWVEDEAASRRRPAWLDFDPMNAYQRIGQAWRLSRQELGVLQALCAWREREARSRDRPRNFIVRDSVLMEIARRQPASVADLKAIEGLHPGEIRRGAQTMLELVAAARDAQEFPSQPANPRDLRSHSGTMARLREAVRRKSGELNVPPELLARKSVLETLVRRVMVEGSRALPESLDGWRRPVIGEHLMSLIDEDLKRGAEAADPPGSRGEP